MASSMDEDSNSEAKNHNINPVGFAELEAVSFRFDIWYGSLSSKESEFKISISFR